MPPRARALPGGMDSTKEIRRHPKGASKDALTAPNGKVNFATAIVTQIHA
jgi:hypothetical protein